MYRATNSYKPHLSVSVINNIQSPSLKVIPESHHVRGGEVVFSGLGRPYQPSWLVLSPYIYIYRYIILYMLLMCIYIYTWSIYIYLYGVYKFISDCIANLVVHLPISCCMSPYLVVKNSSFRRHVISILSVDGCEILRHHSRIVETC